jgi:imidazolonepropionase-like amidohydrolase
VAGGLGDETLPHIPYPEFSFGVVVSGADEMRKVVRMFLKYGVDSVKVNLSGDNFTPASPAGTTWMSDEEVAMAVHEAHLRGKRVAAHARSAASVKQAVRHGIEIIYHASFTDEESLDLLEANKAKHFVAPGIGIIDAMLNHCEPWGIDRAKATAMGYEVEWNAAIDSLRKMHKRGIRVLPGGDYGFAFLPHGQNARDLELFVKHLGFTPMEAILSATRYGGEIMGCGHELGQLRDGYLADLILVDGDPLADLALLREPARILAVMKDGVFYKRPERQVGPSRWARSVA